MTTALTATTTMPIDTPIGRLVLECDGDVLVGVWLPHERRHVRRDVDDVPPVLKETATQLEEYFVGERAEFKHSLQRANGELMRRTAEAGANIQSCHASAPPF